MTPLTLPDLISELVNPITRSAVRIEPPILVATPGELERITARFEAYCGTAWTGGLGWYCDPKVIPSDWLVPGPARAEASG